MSQPYNESRNRDTRVDLPIDSVDGDDHENQTNNQGSLAKNPRRVTLGLGVIVILVIFFIVALIFPQQLKHQLAISILRQQTPYTQLYFTDPDRLPENLRVAQENNLDFTIENSEGRTYSYTYIITLEDSRSRLLVSKETVTIADTGSATFTAVIVPKDRKSKYLISIELQGMNQSIHFSTETS